MRMDPDSGMSVADWLAQAEEQEIAEVIGQMSVFGGVPGMTKAMQVAQGVIAEQGEG